MQYVSITLSGICTDAKQSKSSSRNGSPFDFLCLCGMRAEGWACTDLRKSVGDSLCVCTFLYICVCLCVCGPVCTFEFLHVLSGGPGSVCVSERVY